MKRYKKNIFIILFLLYYLSFTNAQSLDSFVESSNSFLERETLGLVLSGGGAKGLAHIGVLKALEENNIQIDYIVGTSMGAIVGGLYASGYTIDEIIALFLSEEMDEYLQLTVDEKYIPLIFKENNNYFFKLNMDLDNNLKISTPVNVMNSAAMDFSFTKYFASSNYLCKNNYDSLLIPFFCMASDLTNKRQSIQNKGNLNKSIRASMAIPMVFYPITIDSVLLCDGGVYNNFPYKELKQRFNPHKILGVKVVDNFSNPNTEDLILFMENLISQNTDYAMNDDNALLITPNLQEISFMDFSKKEQSINAGYIAAMENMNKIKNLINQQNNSYYNDFEQKRREFNAKKQPLYISKINVDDKTNRLKKVITNILRINIPQQRIPMEDIKANYLFLTTLDFIKSAQLNTYYDENLKDYVLNVEVKTQKPLIFKLSGVISSEPISNMHISLEHFIPQYNYKSNINGYFGRYYTAGSIGFKKYFIKTKPYYINTEINVDRYNYFHNKSGLLDYSPVNYLIQREYNAQFSIGVMTSRNAFLVGKFGIGELNDEYFEKQVVYSSDELDVTNFRNYVCGLKYELSTLNDKNIFTKGLNIKLNAQYVIGKEEFTFGKKATDNIHNNIEPIKHNHSWLQMDLETKYYKPLSKIYSLGLVTKTFYSFQNLFYSLRASQLNAGLYAPNIELLTGFYPEYRVNQFISGGLENVFTLGKSFLGAIYLQANAYVFCPIKEIWTNDQNQPYYSNMFNKIYGIASISCVIKTILGNLTFSTSYIQRDNTKKSPWNISITFGTIMFNNKNIEK